MTSPVDSSGRADGTRSIIEGEANEGPKASRRDVASMLGAAFGLFALGGCAAQEDEPGDSGVRALSSGLAAGAVVAWADTVATDLKTHTNTTLVSGSVVDIAVAKGSVAPGDGGGGVFYWDAALTTDDGGTKILPTGSSAGGWRRIFDGPFNVKWFGARGDNVTDDSTAFANAIAALGPSAAREGATLFLPPGSYYLASNLVINRHMILRGSTGWGNNASSMLKFAEGHGLILAKPNAAWTTLQDLYVISKGAGQSGRAQVDGIYCEVPVIIQRCFVYGFGGYGIHINGEISLGNNANAWQVLHSRVENNELFGFYVHGGNSNAGTAIGLLCITNGLGGIWDSSFAGSTYIGAAAEGNLYAGSPGQAYRVDGGTNRTILVGCYAESDLTVPSEISQHAMLIGGNHPAFSGSPLGLRFETATNCSPVRFYSRASTAVPPLPQVSFTAAAFDRPETAFLFRSEDDTSEDSRFSYGMMSPGWWEFHRGGLRWMMMSGGNAAQGPGLTAFPRGLYVGPPGAWNKLDSGDGSQPDSTATSPYRVGDVVLSRNPAVTGYVGWVCTQVSSSAPFRVWKRFGALEP